MLKLIIAGFAAIALSMPHPEPATAQAPIASDNIPTATFAKLDTDFQRWMQENHVPGLVWGVVQDGKLIHARAFGVTDISTNTPVDADTAFRIASMSKAFTGYAILKLRDRGMLRLDDPVSKHVPEIRKWGSDITVADLLYHNAGFVTDDPWGDRQQPMSEADFTRFISAPVPRNTSRGVRFEYSNFGYALLGRIISNKAKQNFAGFIGKEVFAPLGMKATTYEVRDVAKQKLALGYRWENDRWTEEPTMAHGAFGSMGGVVTTANDYAKWVAHLLTGFREMPGDVMQYPMIRAMQTGGGFPQSRARPGSGAPECRVAAVYAKGLISGNDCVLGPVLFHGGGFPGYGSHMLLIPETGTGIFALSNRTYAGPSAPVWDAATALYKAKLVKPYPTGRNCAVEIRLRCGGHILDKRSYFRRQSESLCHELFHGSHSRKLGSVYRRSESQIRRLRNAQCHQPHRRFIGFVSVEMRKWRYFGCNPDGPHQQRKHPVAAL